MPFSVLIVEENEATRNGLARTFKAQFSEGDDRVDTEDRIVLKANLREERKKS